jgi:hypothetical protein
VRRHWSILALWLVAGCGGAPIVHCKASSDCAPAEICLPAAGGSFCSRLDAQCPSGLRWAPSAGPDLSGQCVVLGADGGAPVEDLATPAYDLAGACAGKSDGTVCAPTSNPCQQAGHCVGGACQPISNVADGTSCGKASDACHIAPTCKGGACQPQGTQPEGYNYDSADYLARCCGGAPVKINTTQNCGACGIACRNGNGCVSDGNNMQWWCACRNVNTDCWSNCCATGIVMGTQSPVCSPSTCGSNAQCTSCPGGSHCDTQNAPHYWCHY